MEEVGSKILVMLLLGSFSMILGFIPMKLGNWFKNQDGSPRHGTIFSSLLCYGGGVLLATSLIHMLPEIRETFEGADIWPEGQEHLPLAEIMLAVGFFLIYFIEEFVHTTCDSKLHGHNHEEPQCEELRCEEQCEEQREQSLAVHRAFSVQTRNCDHVDFHVEEELINRNPQRSSFKRASNAATNPETKDLKVDDTKEAYPTSNVDTSTKHVTTYTTVDENNHTDNHFHQENCVTASGSGRKIALRDFFTVLALSFHSVFEGLAIGLEDKSDVWLLFAAVASHKYVIAFCVGLELHNADTPKVLYIVYMLIFSLMSPIGIAIGIAVTSAMENETTAYILTTGVLQALAAGTLLYVCVFEILEREKSKESVPGLVQLLCVVLGFSTLLLVQVLAPHHHGDEGHHGKKNDVSHCLKVLNFNDTSILSNHISTLPSSFQSSV